MSTLFPKTFRQDHDVDSESTGCIVTAAFLISLLNIY